MRALFVQQDHVSPTGPVGEALTDRGYDVVEFLVVPEESFHQPAVSVEFPAPDAFDVIVPMGAPWSIYDHDAIGSWVGEEIAFLRQAVDRGVPVLGICFGGQALACALGGEVVEAANPEVGWTTIETDRPDLVAAGPWFQWHGDRWVLPSHVRAIARTAVAEQAFVAGNCLGLQFHPELTPSMLDGWLSNGGDSHARALDIDPGGLQAETSQQAQRASRAARHLVHTFLDKIAVEPVHIGA